MKIAIFAIILAVTWSAAAANKFKMDFSNADITTILKSYSEATGQKFIVDSTVRGKITMINPSEVSAEEAYNQLSEALAINGFAIVKNGDWLTVKNARTAQRDNISVSTDLPTPLPMRMTTWVVAVKNTSAFELTKDIRMLTSSYGEMSVNTNTNQLIITDWSTNLQRVAAVIKTVDKPTDPSVSKIVSEAKKNEKQWRESKATKEVKEKIEN